jgi:hypothetical protein
MAGFSKVLDEMGSISDRSKIGKGMVYLSPVREQFKNSSYAPAKQAARDGFKNTSASVSRGDRPGFNMRLRWKNRKQCFTGQKE